MKIIFAGTPDFAASHLQQLLVDEFDVIAVFTQPDRPAGRGKNLQASPVKQLALENNIPVFQPENFKSEEAVELVKDISADVMVVVAYGLILPKSVLSIPPLGCINVHGSILPKWRGAAPIQRAIWNGDKTSGVTTMLMDEGLDTGDILLIDEIDLAPTETSQSLYNKMADIGPQSLVKTLRELKTIKPRSQVDDDATYAKKLSKEEAKIDWTQTAEQIERNIRAFNPWPVSYFSYKGKNIKVWQAELNSNSSNKPAGTIVNRDKTGLTIATSTQDITLLSVQVPGKKAMSISDVLNSRQDWFLESSNLADDE